MARGFLPSLVDLGVTGFLADDELDPVACLAAVGERFPPAVMATAYERLYAGAISRAGGAAAP